MKEQLLKTLNFKKFVINDMLIKVAKEQKLNLDEFLVLAYFDNSFDNKFDVELISKSLGLDNAIIMEAFNSLMIKGLVNLETVKDLDNRNTEAVNLDGLYKLIIEKISLEERANEKEDIFRVFERELGRTISSMELEMINGWLLTGTSEEIILGALREAVYNGVTSFRYIDRIIYEWEKKGLKTMDDVNTHMKNRREEKSNSKEMNKKASDILDYDWIDN